MVAPEADSLEADNPEAVAQAIKDGLTQIASLMKPIFVQNGKDTFFVESDVSERTIEEWEDSIPRPPVSEPYWHLADMWKVLPVVPSHPGKLPVFDTNIDQRSLVALKADNDWLLNPQTALRFGAEVIGSTGRVKVGLSVIDKTALGMQQGGLLQGGLSVVGSAGLSTKLADHLTQLDGARLNANLPNHIDL